MLRFFLKVNDSNTHPNMEQRFESTKLFMVRKRDSSVELCDHHADGHERICKILLHKAYLNSSQKVKAT
jgi:hypothetical protein